MRASVLTVSTPLGIHNIISWTTCGTPASPTSSSDPLHTSGSFFVYSIALRRLPLLATFPIASCFASIECMGPVSVHGETSRDRS